MCAAASEDYITSYIEEVQGYLPVMKEGIASLRKGVQHSEMVVELHRLVHIIRGASSMVGIEGLSLVAGCMEDFLEQAVAAEITPSDEALSIMDETVDTFGAFCQAYTDGTTFDQEAVVSKVVNEFGRFSELLTAEAPHASESKSPHQAGGDAEVESLNTYAIDTNEFIHEFREEAEEHLQDLDGALGQLQGVVDKTQVITPELREIARTIRRSVHTIKGASAVIGLTELPEYAHEVEDFLDYLYESADTIHPPMVEQLAAAVDMLALLVESPEQFDKDRATETLSQLHAYTQAEREGTLQNDQPDEAVKAASTSQVTSSVDQAYFTEAEQQELLGGFHDEAEDHLHDLHASLARLEAKIVETVAINDEHREEIRGVRRSVHTIKGAAAVIGLETIASFAHVLEDFLDWLFEQASDIGPERIKILVKSIDMLAMLIGEQASIQPGQLEKMVGQLRSYQAPEPDAPALVESKETSEAAEPRETELITTGPSQQEAESQALQADTVTTLRVNKDHIDSIINLANELLVGVSAFDGKMELFKEALGELELTRNRLKDIALELEKNFEVKALEDLDQRLHLAGQKIATLTDGESFEEFDALELDRYTQLNLTIRSLNESAIDVGAIQGNISLLYSDIDGEINRQRRNTKALQLQAMRTRMSPMSSITARMGRTMRDVSAKLGKKVRLQVEGEAVELDRVIWERLADPFMHLVRNSVHHGIETGEERQAAGKPLVATISMTAERKGNRVVIRFHDDGRGLDYDAIRAKAIKLGFGEQAASMTEQQLTDLIFAPGFSTKTISEISGRGVGLDVVRAAIHELQGRISLETEADKGTTFVISIPLTLGVVRALMFDSDGNTLAIPLNDITEIRRADPGEIDFSNRLLKLTDETLPLYSADALLGVAFDPRTDMDERPLVLLMELGSERAALVISQILGQSELVIKDLGAHLKSVSGVSGAAILGDGSLVPVLDVSDLVQSGQKRHPSRELSAQSARVRPLNIMVVDDSISIRRVVGRLVSAQGWQPFEAKDGLDALEQLPTVAPDLIVLDVEMPRMNGFEFLAKIANIPEQRDTPVVMLTSRTSAKHREKAFALGATAFLNKPYKDEEFINLVKELTDRVELTKVPTDAAEAAS